MISNQINSIPDDFDENKETKKKFKDILLDAEAKVKTFNKQAEVKESLPQVQLKSLGAITSRNDLVRATGTFDRKDIVFSPDSIRSPKGLKISKRKLKLTDSDIKQISKEINTIKKAQSSSRYDDSYQDEFEQNPANEKIANDAEIGYEYQPDYDDNKESSEAREINKRGELKLHSFDLKYFYYPKNKNFVNILKVVFYLYYMHNQLILDLISPEAINDYEKGQVLFNRSSHSIYHPPSISDITGKEIPKKIEKSEYSNNGMDIL